MKLLTLLIIALLFVGILSENSFEAFKREISNEINSLRNDISRKDQDIQDLKVNLQHTRAELADSKIMKEQMIEEFSYYYSPKTCKELLKHGFNESKNYFLKPGGSRPIQVFCELPAGKASIGQPIETNIEHCDSKFCHEEVMNYDIAMDQLKMLIDTSSNCQQWLKFDCLSSPTKV